MENKTTNQSLKSLQSYIIIKKNYGMALQKRLIFCRDKYALKTEHEKNDAEITMYETNAKINAINKAIYQSETEFEEQFSSFLLELEEVHEYYDKILELAKKHQAQSEQIKHLLYYANWKFINENATEKINFFRNLKETLETFLNTKRDE